MTEQRKAYKIDGRPQTIYRVVKNKDNPYVMIDRRPVDNPTLSFKAKGILTYLLSRPDGWEVSVADLINSGSERCKDGQCQAPSNPWTCDKIPRRCQAIQLPIRGGSGVMNF